MGSDDKKTRIDQVRSFGRIHKESQIEMVLVHVHPDAVPEAPWRMLEFWTANTMYGLDANLKCIEVSPRDPHSEKVPGHLIGASLVGSQSRKGEGFSVSFPYPVPGMEAVFRVPATGKHMWTSIVERVQVRVRMIDMDLSEGQNPDWMAITNQWRLGS